MRAWEFLQEELRVPPLTLKQVNTLKHNKRARQQSFARRDALVPIMYGKPSLEIERIELEKARIELAQLKAEFAQTLADSNKETKDAIHSLAKAGIETSKNRLSQRRKKTFRHLKKKTRNNDFC